MQRAACIVSRSLTSVTTVHGLFMAALDIIFYVWYIKKHKSAFLTIKFICRSLGLYRFSGGLDWTMLSRDQGCKFWITSIQKLWFIACFIVICMHRRAYSSHSKGPRLYTVFYRLCILQRIHWIGGSLAYCIRHKGWNDCRTLLKLAWRQQQAIISNDLDPRDFRNLTS